MKIWSLRLVVVSFSLVTMPWSSRVDAVAPPSADTKRPNVVLITIDDMGWSDLSCYGSDLHESTHIDQFAQHAVRFTQAYAAAPICSPTRAALMTGKCPARLGMTIWHEAAAKGPERDEKLIPPETVANLPREEVTLAEVLREVGYRTIHVGKWHLGTAEYYPETQGFEVNIGGSLWGAPSTYFWPYRGPFNTEIRYIPGLIGGVSGDYLTDRLTDEALRQMDRVHAEPFLLNLCFHSVHTPIEGKPDLVRYYQDKIDRGTGQQHRNATYAAMVHSVDENIGRVLAKLDALQLADSTIVVITSDNGGVAHQNSRWGVITSNAPLRSGKGSLYEGGVRVPLLIRCPQANPGTRECSEPVSTQDLFPTLLELLSLGRPATEVDGVSLAKLLHDPSQRLDREFLCWHYPHYYPSTTPVSSIRRGNDKLLHYYEDDRVELYDLSQDVGERVNLAEDHAGLADQLKHRLDAWLQARNARMPRPNPDYRP